MVVGAGEAWPAEETESDMKLCGTRGHPRVWQHREHWRITENTVKGGGKSWVRKSISYQTKEIRFGLGEMAQGLGEQWFVSLYSHGGL